MESEKKKEKKDQHAVIWRTKWIFINILYVQISKLLFCCSNNKRYE